MIEQKNNIGDLIFFELDKNYTRAVGVVAAGNNYKAGTVLALNESGKYVAAGSNADESLVKIEGGTTTTTGEGEEAVTTVTGGDISLDFERLACAVLLDDCDATAKDEKALVLRRIAIVNRRALVYADDATEEDKKKYEKALSCAGIIVQESM